MITLIILIVLSYLLGSIPFGLVLVYLFKKVDIRTIGSGNIGATNVLRAGGHKWLALVTLILDISKGFIVAYVSSFYFNQNNAFIAGIVAVIGHIFPIYLKFKGGKGVATSIGLVLAINPWLFLLIIVTWFVVALIFKYSSLAAIITFISLPIYAYLININHVINVWLVLLSLLIIIKHKKNIVNLINNTETKIKFKSAKI